MTNYYLEPFLKKEKIKMIHDKENKIQGGVGETTSIARRSIDTIKAAPMTLIKSSASGIGSGLNYVGEKTGINTAFTKTGNVLSQGATLAKEGVRDTARGIRNVFKSVITTSPEHILAKKIVDSINMSLDVLDNQSKQITKDYEKIKNLKMKNQIDLNYGGGFLIFDSNFKVQHMIHLLNDPQNAPKFMSLHIGENMENNTINANLKDNHQPYQAVSVVTEIKKIVIKDQTK